MPKLLVRESGKTQQELELESGSEYLVGRSESCQVKLKEDKSFSRQHFKICQRDGDWIIEVLSQYGGVKVNGEETALSALTSPTSIVLGPYEFLFLEVPTQAQAGALALQDREARSGDLELVPSGNISDDRTMIALTSDTIGVISEHDSHGTPGRQIRISGAPITIGRDVESEFQINNPHISRKQFQISQTGRDYFIVDLSSTTPTLVNGYSIAKNAPVKLNSGDEISVLEHRFQFEVRDSQFPSRVKALAPLDHQNHQFESLPEEALTTPIEPQPRLGYNLRDQVQRIKKMSPIRLALIALVVVGGIGILFDQQAPTPSQDISKPKSPIDNLKPEERRLIMHSYEIAQLSAAQGNFQTTLDELAKIHRALPEGYQDSLRLKADVEAQLEYVNELKRLEEQKKQKEEREVRIQENGRKCRELVSARRSTITLPTLDECLAESISEDPTHPVIAALRLEVQKIEDDRAMDSQRKKEYQEGVARLEQLFLRAKNISQKDPLAGISELEKFSRLDLPDPRDRKGEAKQLTAAIQNRINTQVNSALTESKALEEKGDYKSAIIILEKAATFAPENQTLPAESERLRASIRKKMQPLYQESIVEENFGNLDAAKERWRKILKEDVQSGEYFQKAKMKLKKHGAL